MDSPPPPLANEGEEEAGSYTIVHPLKDEKKSLKRSSKLNSAAVVFAVWLVFLRMHYTRNLCSAHSSSSPGTNIDR